MSVREKELMRVAFGLFVVGLLIIAGAFVVCGFNPLELSRRVSGYEQRTANLVGSFTKVRVEDVDANVYVLPAKDGKCSVIYDETRRSTHHVGIDGDTLTIERQRSWLDSFGIFMSAPKLTVYLPEAAYEELYVHAVSGSVRVEGLNCETLDIQTTSGGIRLTDVNVEGDAGLKCVSGGIKLESVKVGSMNAHTTSGGIKLTSVLAGSLTARTTSGGIRLEGVDAGDMELHSVSGGIKGTVLSDKQFEVSSVSGGVRVSESVPGAGLCRAHTTSGGISLFVEG